MNLFRLERIFRHMRFLAVSLQEMDLLGLIRSVTGGSKNLYNVFYRTTPSTGVSIVKTSFMLYIKK